MNLHFQVRSPDTLMIGPKLQLAIPHTKKKLFGGEKHLAKSQQPYKKLAL